jgi:molybdopterin/thiamine biosynthesis adenylyltransferase
MPVLDMLCRDPRITRVTLIEPDVYKPHNVERHLFPLSAVGEAKAVLARRWLLERRPDLVVELLPCDLCDPKQQVAIEETAAGCDIGVCAADNEPAKYHWDALMRRHRRFRALVRAGRPLLRLRRQPPQALRDRGQSADARLFSGGRPRP